MQRVVTTNKEDEQDETVQESSGCGAGGRYGSLHADGVWQQQIVEGEGCPEGFRHQDGLCYGSGYREDDGRPSGGNRKGHQRCNQSD